MPVFLFFTNAQMPTVAEACFQNGFRCFISTLSSILWEQSAKLKDSTAQRRMSILRNLGIFLKKEQSWKLIKPKRILSTAICIRPFLISIQVSSKKKDKLCKKCLRSSQLPEFRPFYLLESLLVSRDASKFRRSEKIFREIVKRI